MCWMYYVLRRPQRHCDGIALSGDEYPWLLRHVPRYGLAARAPYFHNGSARTLDDVVNFYNQRFGIGFTDQQRRDLVAFLKTL